MYERECPQSIRVNKYVWFIHLSLQSPHERHLNCFYVQYLNLEAELMGRQV